MVDGRIDGFMAISLGKDPPKCLTTGDSSVVALRAVQTVLRDTHFDPFPQNTPVRGIVRVLNNLPVSMRIGIADWVSKSIGRLASDFEKTDMKKAAEWVVSGYPNREYPGVVIGAPGLAATFLCGLTGFPFLPQHLLLNARRDMNYDDAQAYLDAGKEIGQKLVDKNPGIEATVHFDPVHDRFLIGRVVFVRTKFSELPEVYKKFIAKKLKPGAMVIMLDCTYPWSRAKISDNLYFQLGGLGGFTDRDYIDEIQILRDYRSRWGGTVGGSWKIDLDFETGPESEWGSVGSLLDQTSDLASGLGLNSTRYTHNHPGDLSRAVFRLYRRCWDGPDRPKNIYTGVFSHTEPRFPLVTGALPIWLPFITDENLALADDILSEWRRDEGIEGRVGNAWITLHPSFCAPPDIVSLDQWRTIFGKYFENVVFPGIDPGRYPFDLGSYVAMYPSMVSIAGRNRFDGVPFRKPAYNDLIDLLKV